MLINKIQNFFNKKIDFYSIHKLEKLIIKNLYNDNIGPESTGINDIRLRSYSQIKSTLSANPKILNNAMKNLAFKGFLTYNSDENLQYDAIKLTLDGMLYHSKNHIFVKQTLITSFISGIFSILISIITNLVLK